MLEVVFSDSVKGSMKVAKNYDQNSFIGGAVAYIGEKPTREQLKKKFEGQAIEGNSQDVVSIGFSLDIGDISGEIDGRERKNLFRKFWERYEFDGNELEEYFDNQKKDFDKLVSYAKDGIPIRIWKGNSPYALCGFYFVCSVLRNVDCDLSVVSLPEYIETSDKEIIKYSGWGEIAPGKFYRFLPFEKQLSKAEKIMFSNKWDLLVKENAPLRALVNGELISVDENFYDFLINNNLPDNDFLIGRFIGEIMGKYQLGVSDGWYALRLDKMLDEGCLQLVEDKDKSHPYGRILRKSV